MTTLLTEHQSENTQTFDVRVVQENTRQIIVINDAVVIYLDTPDVEDAAYFGPRKRYCGLRTGKGIMNGSIVVFYADKCL